MTLHVYDPDPLSGDCLECGLGRDFPHTDPAYSDPEPENTGTLRLPWDDVAWYGVTCPACGVTSGPCVSRSSYRIPHPERIAAARPLDGDVYIGGEAYDALDDVKMLRHVRCGKALFGDDTIADHVCDPDDIEAAS